MAARKWVLFALAFLIVSLCAGLVYGWPALRRNLVESGSTLSEEQLGAIYTAGAWSTQGGRFLFGLARDRFGTKRTTLVSLLCVIGGSLGIALCDASNIAALASSVFLIGLGSGSQLCLQPVAGLFSKAGTILASLSGAFQVSGLIFLALTSITDNRMHSFVGFALLVALLGIASAVLLPMGPSFVLEEEYPVDAPEAKEGEEGGDNKDENEDASGNNEDEPREQKSLRLKRIRRLLFHSEYISLLSWFSVCIVPLQYYVGSIGFILESKGDEDGFFTALFSILYAAAALLAPFGGYLADMLGLAVTQALATLLVASSMFILASPAPLNVQSVGFATYSVGRMLTFGMYFTNVGKRFGYANYGSLAGLGLLVSAIISLVQFPLIALAASGKAKNVNLSCGIALIAILPYCIWLGWKERSAKAPVDEEIEIEQKEGDNIDLSDMIEGGDDQESSNEMGNEMGQNNQQQGENSPSTSRPARERRMTFMASFLRKPSYFGS